MVKLTKQGIISHCSYIEIKLCALIDGLVSGPQVRDNELKSMVPPNFTVGINTTQRVDAAGDLEADIDANSFGVGAVENDLIDSDNEDLNFGEDLEDISDEDDSDVDEELRGFREKQRQEKREEQKKN
ncbi:hypothetical protein K7X08_033480 [Anisodus acutangulus]|uniref:Uncharacterized protein n=1 Tax=Anisodus acutangulus TaxID=402998 RepID=A0A9Q1M518_9SOLA|nr:hypothetical protein K7X08_033480 [Anisodus acutangulus]